MRYLLILAVTQSCLGMDIPTFVSAVHSEAGNVALRRVHFQMPPDIVRVHSITYGNPHIGFFRLNKFVNRDSSIEFEIIPPGYRENTQFLISATARNGRRRLFTRSRQFDSPFPKAFRQIGGTLHHGSFSPPFIFLTAQVKEPWSTAPNALNSGGTQAPMAYFRLAAIINRYGELVYTLPTQSGRRFNHIHIDNSRLFRFISHDTIFTFDLKNLRLSRTCLSPATNSVDFHNDMLVEGDNLIALIKEPRTTDWGLFSGAFAIVKEQVDRIARLNLASGQVTPLWDVSQAFSPLLFIKEGRQQTLRPGLPKQTTHLNSIVRLQNGNYLLSARDLNRLLIFNPSLTKVVATIGNTPHDTFQTPDNNPFSFQHHATQLPSGNILLFDNGTPERNHSRVIELQLAPKKAVVADSWSSGLYTSRRGSVYAIGDRLIAFFVGNRHEGAISNLIEYDYFTKKEWARMTFPNDRDEFHYRATPIFSIGDSQWIAPSTKHPFSHSDTPYG